MRDVELRGVGSAKASRRDVLKKALTAGGAIYVAPMVIGSATKVSAQGISGINPACVGATCVNFIACNGNENCVCFTLADGQGFCGTGVSCAGLSACSAESPCGAGFVCQVNTCCGAPGICVPSSTACPPPGVPASAPSGPGPWTSRLN